MYDIFFFGGSNCIDNNLVKIIKMIEPLIIGVGAVLLTSYLNNVIQKYKEMRNERRKNAKKLIHQIIKVNNQLPSLYLMMYPKEKEEKECRHHIHNTLIKVDDILREFRICFKELKANIEKIDKLNSAYNVCLGKLNLYSSKYMKDKPSGYSESESACLALKNELENTLDILEKIALKG